MVNQALPAHLVSVARLDLVVTVNEVSLVVKDHVEQWVSLACRVRWAHLAFVIRVNVCRVSHPK